MFEDVRSVPGASRTERNAGLSTGTGGMTRASWSPRASTSPARGGVPGPKRPRFWSCLASGSSRLSAAPNGAITRDDEFRVSTRPPQDHQPDKDLQNLTGVTSCVPSQFESLARLSTRARTVGCSAMLGPDTFLLHCHVLIHTSECC